MTPELRRHAGRGSGTGASAGATDPSPTAPPPTDERADAPPDHDRLTGALVTALRETRHETLFATELAAVARDAGCPADRFERLLAQAAESGLLLVLGRPPPDVHLAGTDLRTVHLLDDPSPAAAETARRRGEEHWADFLRTFLATRRCC